MGNLFRYHSNGEEHWRDAMSGVHVTFRSERHNLRRIIRLLRKINEGDIKVYSANVYSTTIFLQPIHAGSGGRDQTALPVEALSLHSLDNIAASVQRNFCRQRESTHRIANAFREAAQRKANRSQTASPTEKGE